MIVINQPPDIVLTDYLLPAMAYTQRGFAVEPGTPPQYGRSIISGYMQSTYLMSRMSCQ